MRLSILLGDIRSVILFLYFENIDMLKKTLEMEF